MSFYSVPSLLLAGASPAPAASRAGPAPAMLSFGAGFHGIAPREGRGCTHLNDLNA